jgi:hypothetical protein
MAKIINTYSGGLDQDASKTKYPNTKYFDCLDLSIVAESNQSQFSLSNERGNKFLVDIPQLTLNKLTQQFSYLNINGTTTTVSYTNNTINALASPIATYNPIIIGYCVVRDQVILFTTDVDVNSTNYDTGGVGQIWSLQYNQSTFVATSLELLYCHDLGFTTKHPIYDEARGRYENSDVIKVYWTDNYNYFRFANIADTDLINTEPGDLDVIADITSSEPQLLNVLQGGSFLSGEVQYAYNLYNLYGSESATSTLSPLYSLSPTFKKGGIKGSAAGKSLEVQINNIDENFDYIKIYRVYYDDYFQQPLIHLIREEPITNTTFIFIDDGATNIQSLSLEEFQFISTEPFYCKSIEDKDNYIFPANIRKDKFEVDWDSRAYRFPINSTTTTVEDVNGSTSTITSSYSLAETHDAINPDDVNNLFNQNVYKYQFNSNILGGTGPNVSYQFKVNSIVGDENSNSAVNYRKLNKNGQGSLTLSTENNEVKNYGSPFLNGKIRSFKRDETYRFGIVFFNNKGQESYAKWIGDIRMPAISDIDGQTTFTGMNDFRLSRAIGQDTQLFTLHPEFTINNVPTTQDIVGAKIVYVKRETKDKTIIAQGLVTPTMYNLFDNDVNPNGQYVAYHYIKNSRHFDFDTCWAGTNDTASTETGKPLSQFQTRPDLVQFTSPEVNFLRNVKYRDGNYLTTAGLYTNYHQTTKIGSSTSNGYATALSQTVDRERLTKMYTMEPISTTGHQKVPLKDGKLLGFGKGEVHNVGGIYYRNYANLNQGVNSGAKFESYSNTSFLANLNDIGLVNYRAYQTGNNSGYAKPISSTGNEGFILADYKQQVNSQYGGNSYSSRTLNVYQPSSLYIPITSGTTTYTINGLQGDTFISYFDCLKGMWDNKCTAGGSSTIFGNGNHTGQEVLYFPVETQINLDLRHDTHYADGNNSFMLHETVEQGIVMFDGTGIQSTTYPTVYTDQYLYNFVYSKQNDFIEYFPEPLNAPSQEEFDCRVLHSEQKFNGENLDKWTKFKANNFIDVDSPFGPINRVILIRDEIAFVQDNGFGLLSINPRVQVEGSDGVAVELGKGSVLHDFNYISKEYGSIHQFGINSSNQGLYIPDTSRQKIILANPQTNVLTDIKGLHKFLMLNINNEIITNHNPIEKVGVISVFDKLNNRMLFTFMDRLADSSRPPVYTYSSYTLGYNELTQSFESFYSFKPNLYIKDRRRILSTDSTIKKLYTHNEGNYGVFYDQTPSTAKVELIINPAQNISTVFTNLAWLTEVYDTNNADLFNETLTALRITNEYQDTGLITITPGTNIRRLMREWHYVITRNTLSGNNDRIRNPYIKLELYFTNVSNKKFILHDVVTDVTV